MILRNTCLSALAAAALMGAAVPAAHAYVEAGVLNCRSSGAVAYVIGATLNFQCMFLPAGGGYAQPIMPRFNVSDSILALPKMSR
jgi:hypothetical protein